MSHMGLPKMERSMSLDSSADYANNNKNTNNNNYNDNNNHLNNNNNNNNNKNNNYNENTFNTKASLQLRSNKQTTTTRTTKTTTLNRQQQLKSSNSTAALQPHYITKRKRQLQRQQPMEHCDDIDYAADLEEEDEEEEDGAEDGYDDENERHASPTVLPAALPKLPLAPAHQKRLQFQKYRQHSNVALTPTTPISPPFHATSGTMAMNGTAASPCPLPAHSLAHLATRSSSTSSANSIDSHFKHQDSFESTVSLDTPLNRRQQFFALQRDNSMQSDSSRYSSLECMLEARKPDPEAILINLGFGPVDSDDILSRIPARFLKPSQVRGIDTSAFVKRLQLQLQLADHSVLGYRGLTGNPDIPPSSIVAKIMQRFEVNERKKSMGSLEHTI